jgi:hypothetical protein
VGKFHGVLSLESTRRHKHIALATISQEFAALRDFDPVYVGSGSCVTRIAGPNGDAQLYER